MHTFAVEVASQLQAGSILLLYGELGSGKTTFVQGLAKALGITDRVTSPTFTIVGEYNVPPDKGGARGVSTLVHVDLYRLEEATASTDPAVRDVLDRASDPHLRQGSGGQAGRLTVIEWADRLGGSVPQTAQRMSFAHGAISEERIVTFP